MIKLPLFNKKKGSEEMKSSKNIVMTPQLQSRKYEEEQYAKYNIKKPKVCITR